MATKPPAKKPRSAAQKAATRKMIAARRKSINRPSQITKAPPTKRLKKRRAKDTIPGYFPNPSGIWLDTHQLEKAALAVFAALKREGKANTAIIMRALEKWAGSEGFY